MSRGGGCRYVRRIIVSGRGRGGQKNFSTSNNWNNNQELKFYPNGNGTDLQTSFFNKVKEHLTLNIQSEFLNRSDIVFSIRKGVILDLSKEIPIQRISEEDEPSGAE